MTTEERLLALERKIARLEARGPLMGVYAVNGAGTNAVIDVLGLEVTSKGTPADGIGVGLPFRVEDASGNIDTAGRIDVVLTTAAHATEVAEMRLGVLGSTVLTLTQGKASAAQLASSVATGTAPLVVTSTTKVANLNADQVDGQHLATTDGPTFNHLHITTPNSGNLVSTGSAAGVVLRVMYISILNGTDAAHIKCASVNRWNGDANASQDNIGADGVLTGVWTLAAGGATLTLADAGITGSAVAVLAARPIINATTVPLVIDASASGGGITMTFYNNSAAPQSLPTLVDTGNLYIELAYLTTS